VCTQCTVSAFACMLSNMCRCILLNTVAVFFGCQSPADGGQDLFSARFEPQILAAMSRHVALFPPARPDDSYPPQLHKASSSSQSRSSGGSPRTCYRNQITAPKQNSLSPEKAAPGTGSPKAIVDLNTRGAIFGKCSQRSLEKLKHRPTMRYVLNPVDFMPQNGVNTTLYPAHFPLSNETLASLSTFCFPGIILQMLFTQILLIIMIVIIVT